MSLPKRIALAIVATAVALELLLQLGALVVSIVHDSDDAAAEGGADIVCVGDSFTYGLGAEDESLAYPAQLEEQLGPEAWDVANLGFPGRTSRDVLDVLHPVLQSAPPRYVCVLVGINDSWNPPEPWQPPAGDADSTTGFRLEWRTKRLVTWLVGRFTKHDREVTPRPAEATTAEPEREIGDEPPPAAPVAEPKADRGTPAPESPRREPPRPETRPGPAPRPKPAPPPARDESILERAKAALAADDTTTAIDLYRTAIVDSGRPDLARARLAALLRQAGAREESQALVRDLETKWRASPADRDVASNLLKALNGSSDTELTLELTRDFNERWPDAAWPWVLRARTLYLQREFDAANRIIDAAFEHGANTRFAHQVKFDVAYKLGEIDMALRASLRSFVRGQTAAFTTMNLKRIRPDVSDDDIEAVITAEAADATVADGFRAAWRKAGGDSNAWQAILESHLRTIVTSCRANGSRVVFVGYPTEYDCSAVLRRVAAELDVPFVEPADEIQALAREHGRERYFSGDDSHSNGAGYAVTAARVAAEIRRLESRR